MTTEQGENTSGTIMRGADGSLYFIRDEVLQACKVTEPEMAAFCEELVQEYQGEQDDTSGFYLSSGPITQTVALQGPFATVARPNPIGLVAYTSMCPGTMGYKQFSVLPQVNRRF